MSDVCIPSGKFFWQTGHFSKVAIVRWDHGGGGAETLDVWQDPGFRDVNSPDASDMLQQRFVILFRLRMFSNLASYIFGSSAEEPAPELAEPVQPARGSKPSEDEEWVVIGEAPAALTLGSLNDVAPRPSTGWVKRLAKETSRIRRSYPETIFSQVNWIF